MSATLPSPRLDLHRYAELLGHALPRVIRSEEEC